MNYHFEKLSEDDCIPVIDIFNHFIENSDSAYPGTRLSYDNYTMLLNMTKGYPAVAVRDDDGGTIGFGFLRPYNLADTLQRTAEITYFLMPEHTRKGIGKALLDYLVAEAKAMGIDNILASISSKSEDVIKFHLKHGFIEVGRFGNVGKKFGSDFDVVWMQKKI